MFTLWFPIIFYNFSWNFSGNSQKKFKTFCIDIQKVKNKVLSRHVYTIFTAPFFGIFGSSQKIPRNPGGEKE